MKQSKTITYYQLVLSFIGNSTNSYAPESFTSEEDAIAYFEKEYKNRCKNDGRDEYWNNLPLYIQKTVSTIEAVRDERTDEQVAMSHVHQIDGKYKFLLNNEWSVSYETKESCIAAFIYETTIFGVNTTGGTWDIETCAFTVAPTVAYREFIKAYNKAKADKLEQFLFDSRDVLVGYAYYLIEFWVMKRVVAGKFDENKIFIINCLKKNGKETRKVWNIRN